MLPPPVATRSTLVPPPGATPVMVRVSVASLMSSPRRLTVTSTWSVAEGEPVVPKETTPPVAVAAGTWPAVAGLLSWSRAEVMSYSLGESADSVPLKVNGTNTLLVRTPPLNATRKVAVAFSPAAASLAGACWLMVTRMASLALSVTLMLSVLPPLV